MYDVFPRLIYERKKNEIKTEIPSITNFAALTTVEKKILNVSDLAKKSDYDSKI